MMTPPDRCTAEIDRAALRHNLQWLRSLLPAGGRVAAVLKANAYGHGLREVAQSVHDLADLFAVANLVEAQELRSALPGRDVLILGPALPGEREAVIREGVSIVVSSLREAQAYATIATERNATARLHLAVDSGMGRIGVWHENAVALAKEIAALPGIRLEGIGSHLPAADCDQEWTEREQLTAWRKLADALHAEALLRDTSLHLLNSAGIILYGSQPELAGAFVRAGLALYGVSPFPPGQPHELRPALTLRTALTLVRDVPAGRGISYGRTFITPRPMRIGTLAAGYGDGYPRHLSGGAGAEVLVNGQRCAVLGRVTMDQILVDLTAAPTAQEGDEVVLIGAQGAERVTAEELAEKAGTIPWEILTGITQRVVRRYRS